uniref:Methyltransferase FkbM domain-containing protein n=1 Tax=Panagrolaimus sp. JU765 TaxID=591449 RepID=A0AC34Q360_9BILA
MTLGIGKDVSAEMAFKKAYPRTEFFGVDLDEEISGKMFREQLGGKFIRGLVGLNHGNYLASVVDYDGKEGYTDHNLTHYSFKEILEMFEIKQPIDLLLMDIEGDEFPLIPAIMKKSNDYPIICQIDTEFHDIEKYNMTDITNIMSELTKTGKYLYAHQSSWTTFYRSFLINVVDPYCLKKFYGF